jgi:tetratricopeptide (TPR) repeat protein
VIERAVANFKTWRCMFTDYRRPLRIYPTAFRTVRALHFSRVLRSVAGVDGRVGVPLGRLLVAMRVGRGWSQEELAARSGMSVRAIRDLERGHVLRPRRTSIALLADAMELGAVERSAVAEAALGAASAGGVIGRLVPFVKGDGSSSSQAAAGVEPADGVVVAGAMVAGTVGGWPAPALLPADVSAFSGRVSQLEELDAVLLGRGRGQVRRAAVAVVTGTAGVGKTALALRWAHRVREWFPDGQMFVDLRGYARAEPRRPIEALAVFLYALGVPGEHVPVDVEPAAGLYRTLLSGRRMLIVLDNAQSPEQVRPLLPSSPGCRVLVTSRDRLSGLVAREGAHRVGLDVLTEGEARLLLALTVGDERVEAEPEAAAELALMCARLPLALRIAAARLSHYPRRIADQVAELVAGNRLSALDADGDEQAALRATFDLSYDALRARERRLFRMLGLLPGSELSAEATAALADLTVEQAVQSLERLAAAHLVNRQPDGRFALHDLMRLYAAERCEGEDSEQDREAAIRRLLKWYLRTADAAARQVYPERLRLPLPPLTAPPVVPDFADSAHALGWLDGERANLVALIHYAASQGPRPVASLLADALRACFCLRMFMADWLAVAHTALGAAQLEADLPGQAAAQLSLGDAYVHQGEHENATQAYSAGLALTRQAGWVEGQAAVLNNLGVLDWRAGRLHEAEEHHDQALKINRSTGSISGQAANLINLGRAYLELGRLDRAAACETRALALSRETGSRVGEGEASSNLGDIYCAQGRLDDALGILTHALDLQGATSNPGVEAESLRVLAQVHCAAGRPDQAMEVAHTALTLALDFGDRRREADTMNTLAACHVSLGHHTEATELHHRALNLARRTQIHYSEAVALLGLAVTGQHAGDTKKAVAHAQEALALTRDFGYRCLEGQALSALADVHLARGQPAQAIEYGQQALTVHRETSQRLHQAHTHLLLCRALRLTQGVHAAMRDCNFNGVTPEEQGETL